MTLNTTSSDSGKTSTGTIWSLTPGTRYYYSLFASTVGQNSTSNAINCTGWTGELLSVTTVEVSNESELSLVVARDTQTGVCCVRVKLEVEEKRSWSEL